MVMPTRLDDLNSILFQKPHWTIGGVLQIWCTFPQERGVWTITRMVLWIIRSPNNWDWSIDGNIPTEKVMKRRLALKCLIWIMSAGRWTLISMIRTEHKY